MFAGSMAVAVINYLYYPVLGRMLSTAHFGEVQALISVFLQVSLLLAVIGNVTVNIVANAKDKKVRNHTAYELERATTILMAIIIGTAYLFIVPIQHFLQFDSPWPIVVLGLSLVMGAVASMRGAFIRGVKAFKQVSIFGLIGSISKLIFAVIFVAAGFDAAGAIAGLVVAQLLTYLYERRAARKLGLIKEGEDKLFRWPDISIVKPQLPYAGLVLVVSLSTTVLFSIDTILAKHYFSPETAGLYAGIATTARIIYFATGSIATVLLSSVVISNPKGKNRKLLLSSIGIATLVGGSILAFMSVFPHFTVTVLLGAKYDALGNLLPLLALTMFLLSLVNLVFSYDLALRRPSIAVISTIGVSVTALAISLHHATPLAIVQSLLIGAVTLLSLRAGWWFIKNSGGVPITPVP